VDEIIARLSEVFTEPLPGWEAQSRMINYDRPKVSDVRKIDPQARRSAVMALLYPKNNTLHTVLMLRNSYRGTHSGQVSFPGGKSEEWDKSLWHTALREAREEVGIQPKTVRKIGELTPVYIPPSRFLVFPFLAITNKAPTFIPDPLEVNRIIETPVAVFMDPKNRKQKKLFVSGVQNELEVAYFDVDCETVWGATAMILSEISELIKNAKINLSNF